MGYIHVNQLVRVFYIWLKSSFKHANVNHVNLMFLHITHTSKRFSMFSCRNVARKASIRVLVTILCATTVGSYKLAHIHRLTRPFTACTLNRC